MADKGVGHERWGGEGESTVAVRGATSFVWSNYAQ